MNGGYKLTQLRQAIQKFRSLNWFEHWEKQIGPYIKI